MNRAAVAAALLAAGCGRSHFSPCGPPDAPVDVSPTSTANIAFVTSSKQLPTSFGADRSGADAICNARAAAAGLPGNYLAWLSTSTESARDRLASSRGWVRTDGRPFVDRIDDLAIGKIYTPLFLDENGTLVTTSDPVPTATFGGLTAGADCNDYSNPAGQIIVGSSGATAESWTYANTTTACSTPGRLYCFGTGKSAPLTFQPAPGRRAFLTVQNYSVDVAGLATADGLCATEAQLAGLTGSYRALLAGTTATAISRFSLAGATWIRLDGIPLADSPLAFAAGARIAPLNVTSAMTYAGAIPVITGGGTVNAAAADYTANCNDWTDVGGTSVTAVANYADATFFNNSSNEACFGHPIYCLEE
ncbi:MAG TPA: hypothetical protein VLB44_12015 [Kofleriaceae bacterium]|nr:hypothetical protein [Kofleriaceae bacterium]